MGIGAMAVLALMSGCHKNRGDDADAASSRSLQVEAYDPVIPKTPVKGKLETLAEHPEDAARSLASSDATPLGGSRPPTE